MRHSVAPRACHTPTHTVSARADHRAAGSCRTPDPSPARGRGGPAVHRSRACSTTPATSRCGRSRSSWSTWRPPAASPADCGITEIGAVKVRGGEELGEFGTLVNPGLPIPPFITVLTGITEAMLAPAPPLEEVLPAFLEFAQGAVWVAHNAPYDIGFLKAACAQFGYPWPKPRVLDTVALARRALTGDEVPNHKLARWPHLPHPDAEPPGARRRPGHRRRAARAVRPARQLQGLHDRRRDRVRQGGHADPAPQAPPGRRPARRPGGLRVPGRRRPAALRRHVPARSRPGCKSYFTAAEKRARISEMLHVAVRVEAIECAHSLEAEVRELRLIAAHKPPYNRRSKYPERVALAEADRGGLPAAVDGARA